MSRRPARRRVPRPTIEVRPGERLLAWAVTDSGHLGGTRDALYLTIRSARPDGPVVESVETTRIPWEEIQAADWNPDESVLRVAEVGSWGQRRPVHRVLITEPGRLLELVRERVTASIVLQRHVAVTPRRGLRIIARRAPHGAAPARWILEYDDGVDPQDPAVRRAAEAGLANARNEIGLS
jgi:hypothetical protein